MSYYQSLFSFKKITYKKISIFSVWDSFSFFTKKTHILPFAKLKNVQIKEFSRIGAACSITNTKIGRFTAIGKNCRIGLGQHPTNYLSTNSIFYKKGQLKDEWALPIDFEESKPIIIGNDIWIGVNSIIMDGVCIGDGAIIAAGSIVTKDVPPYGIVGGVPAKVIKFRFTQVIIDKLLKIKWWDLPEEEITKAIEAFNNFNVTIDLLDKYFI